MGLRRPPLGRLANVDSALDIDTGGGEIVNESSRLPPHMVVTESWPPNAQGTAAPIGDRLGQAA